MSQKDITLERQVGRAQARNSNSICPSVWRNQRPTFLDWLHEFSWTVQRVCLWYLPQSEDCRYFGCCFENAANWQHMATKWSSKSTLQDYATCMLSVNEGNIKLHLLDTFLHQNQSQSIQRMYSESPVQLNMCTHTHILSSQLRHSIDHPIAPCQIRLKQLTCPCFSHGTRAPVLWFHGDPS